MRGNSCRLTIGPVLPKRKPPQARGIRRF